MELEEESFDLREHVRGTVEMLGMQAGNKQLRLDMEISPEIPAKVVGEGSLRCHRQLSGKPQNFGRLASEHF